jgi:predicted lipoprotein with Yx(FWY)xxD motif
MTRPSRSSLPAALVSIGLALALAACETGGAGSPAAAGSPGTDDAVVSVGSAGEVGEVVVDAEGRTLYVFLNDSPGTSVCTDECASAWPPSTVAEGTTLAAGDGVTAGLGTLERDDGTLQLTLDGWPLYRYAADAAPGDASGEGVGGVWFVARPDGTVAEPSEAPSAGASADGSGTYDPYDY